MKLTSTLMVAVIATFFLACSGNESNTSGAQQPANTAPGATTQPLNNASTAVAGSVKHYICANNCEGSGSDAAGNCPVCGNQYVHNAAFHNQPGNQNQPAPVFQDGQQPPAQNASPAQNAAGVYHYTCTNGCAGGSGAQGTCATCGAALAHNQAYHN
ncbi:MAG: hypothetical protein KDD02_15080 [Phaeodactylibacter sp.]|nr:hypothetical protein [Phaeodactylibacter sp.]MCB9304385.1 hypothetical protein [Lewinellaceae bacterium]